MKQTTNINIAGRPFTIDSDAYEMLQEYLDTLSHAFHAQGYGPELLDDIEERISDLLTESLESAGSLIVTVADVKAIIARVGRPEEMVEIFDGETPAGSEVEVEVQTDQPLPPPYTPPTPRKRLYRDPNDSMLGGVCSGVAAYLGVDPTWVRLGVVVLCFLSFSTVAIIYFILWMILPQANTPLQRLQMRGEAATVENIGEAVTATDQQQSITERGGFIGGFLKFCAVLAKIFLVFMTIVSIPVCILIAMALLLILFCWIFQGVGDTAALALGEFGIGGSSLVLTWLTALGVLLLIGIPAFTLAIIGINKLRNKPAISRPWSLSLLIIWVIAFGMTSVCSGLLSSRDDIREAVSQTRVIATHFSDDSNSSSAIFTAGTDSIVNHLGSNPTPEELDEAMKEIEQQRQTLNDEIKNLRDRKAALGNTTSDKLQSEILEATIDGLESGRDTLDDTLDNLRDRREALIEKDVKP